MIKNSKYLLTRNNKQIIHNLNTTLPKLKYIEFKKNTLYAMNNIDNDILNKNSQFLIGSITKLFTIFITLKLQEMKLLNINDTLDKYFNNTEKNNFSGITLFNIMNNTSGIRMIPENTTRECYQHKEYTSCTDIVNTFIDDKLFVYPVGEYNYSIIGYILLGKILENVTDKNYKKIFNEFIIDPLELSDTFVGYTNTKLYKNNKLIDENQKKEIFFGSVTGGLCSSIEDLLKFSSIFQLLNCESIGTLKKMYIFSESYDKYIIHHKGNMIGGQSTLSYTYDKKFNMLDTHIKLSTN